MMNKSDHEAQEKRVHEAMKKHGHAHDVSYHHGIVSEPEHKATVFEATKGFMPE